MLISRRLRCFLAVAELLHFGRAADQLDLAQSAVSRQVQELESDLGVRLLNRGRRSSITLTEAGAALAREASVGALQLEQASALVHQIGRGEAGRLTVGYVISAALSGLLPSVLGRFRAQHERIAIQLNALDTPSQLAALARGSLDIGFLRPRKEYPAGVSVRVIHREEMLLALAADHPLARQRFELQHLARERFIIPQFDEFSGFAEHLAQLSRAGGFEPVDTRSVGDFLTAMTMAAAGYGVVPVPRCMLGITMRNLVFRKIHGYRGVAELVVAYNQRRSSRATQGFMLEAEKLLPGTASTRDSATSGNRPARTRLNPDRARAKSGPRTPKSQ